MNRLDQTFHRLSKDSEKGLIGYITAGYPTLQQTQELLTLLTLSGCDIIELGVPYSDPIADGPVIQESSFAALQNGATLKWCLEQSAEFRKRDLRTPIVLMGYCNPFWRYGLKNLAADCRSAGIDALVIPDLSLEEFGEWKEIFAAHQIYLTTFLAPTTSSDRIKRISELSAGFVYCLSIAGVTGAALSAPSEELERNIRELQRLTDTPTAIGFGISTPEHAARLKKYCDAVIVGSAIVRAIKNGKGSLEEAGQLIASIKEALKAEQCRPRKTRSAGRQPDNKEQKSPLLI